MHQKLKRLFTKRNVIILSILIALGLVTGVTINYVDKNGSNDVEINLVASTESSSSNSGEQETIEVIEEKPQETDEVESETQNDEKESGVNANQVITISRPQFSYFNRPLTENQIQNPTTTTPPVSNDGETSNSSPNQGMTSVDVSLTLFLSEYQILDNDVVQVKVGNEQAFNAQTSEKGFLKLQLPFNSTTHLMHSSIESIITVNANGEVSVENIKGESMIGFMERSEAGEVKYRENITTFPTEMINNIELLDLESGQFIYNGALELETNEILVIPAFDQYVSGVAIKIVSVNVEGGKTTAVIVQPELKEVYRSIDIEVEPRLEDAVVTLGEDIELSEPITYTSEPITDTRERITVNESLTLKIKPIKLFNKRVELEGSATTKIENSVKINIDFDWFDTNIKNLKYELKLTQEFGVSVKYKEFNFDMCPEEECKLKIADISIPTPVAGISIDIPVKLKFELTGTLSSTLNFGATFNFGMQYTDRNGLKSLVDKKDMFKFEADFTPLKFSGEAKIGPTPSVMLAALRMDLVGLGIGAGIKGTADLNVDWDSNEPVCVPYSVAGYGSLGLDSQLIKKKYLDKLEYEKSIPLFSGKFGLCGQGPELEVSPKNIVMVPDEEVHLMLMSGNEEVTFDAKYESKEPSKLSVNSDGVLTAKEAGAGHTVIVTASYKKDGLVTEVDIPVVIKDLTAKGILKGKIIDAVSEQPVNDAKITLYTESGSYLNKYYTDESGYYRLILEPGIYLVSIEKAGYVKETGRVIVTVGGTTTYQPTLNLISELDSGDGTVKGKITHAITDYPLSQVKLDIYKGFNSDGGDLVTTIYTDELGEYTTVLPAGNYTAKVSKEGFVTSTMNILSIGDKIKGQPTLSLSPDGLGLNDLRIVLNWGSSPSDLDSHLIGEINSESNSYFHVYYDSSHYSGENQSAMLDRDDTFSYGPETITLTNLDEDGHYVYAIHDYSNRGNMQSNALSLSGATVNVYSGTHLLSSFSVPEDGVGNVWKVFEVIDGEIVPLNEVTSISNWHNYQSYLPNRMENLLSIEPVSDEFLLTDEKDPSQLEEFKPETELPESEVEQPEADVSESEVEQPETDVPESEVEQPENDVPESEIEQPETDVPESEVEQPETDVPESGVEQPETDMPESEVGQPETDVPESEVGQPETDSEELEQDTLGEMPHDGSYQLIEDE
ncbi:carboxypeptidase regulatory-like domain-containing protein [Turicibacter sanguinis]|uniref:carboxypeptidase regulatory-like domain-containing protein n=1 Tax=Turicibacter sanguinis TaxID=154288 RepID=UPI00232F93EC|nr:carboxypeptidase regulatory-like domain-containing protein [Turicibacter sanguinis]MDB8540880.1 carboxypeptidase regulatory-like domain-containing protein [Turicibacter sanguinis]